jgi:hypothetical protein
MIWKDIEGYEGIYQISNTGIVKNIKTDHIMKPNKLQGYYVIQLSNKNKRHTFQIHRLIAKAFIPNPNNYPFINHINEDRTDNRIENLEWCTQNMNVEHSRRKMYHPVDFSIQNTTKYIYKKKYSTTHKGKKYTYSFYRVNIPRIKIDKVFSNIYKAIAFRNECIPLMEEFYNKKQKEYSI